MFTLGEKLVACCGYELCPVCRYEHSDCLLSVFSCGHWGWLKPHCGPVAVCTVVLGGYVLTSDQQGTEPGHNSQRVSLCGRVRPACRDVHSVRWSGRTVPQRAVAQHGVACSAPSGTPWSSLRRGAVEASVLPCQQVTVFKRIIRTGEGRGRAPILYTKICTPNVYTKSGYTKSGYTKSGYTKSDTIDGVGQSG